MSRNEIIENYIVGRGETDWLAGSTSPIVRKVLVEDGNWKTLNIPNEVQFVNDGKNNVYDTLECVLYNGVTDPIEYILMQKLRLGLVPAWKVTWLKDNGYFKDGVLNFNENYLAILSGTNEHGTRQDLAIQAARENGMIPNDLLPNLETFEKNLDPKRITPELLALGKQFAKYFQIQYEWITRDIVKEWLKYSPIACFGYYANRETENDILNPQSGSRHSMLVVDYGTIDGKEYLEIDDSYWQLFKKYTPNALDGFMAFYVETDNTMDSANFIKANDLKIVWHRKTGAYYLVMQGMLKKLRSTDRTVLALVELQYRNGGKVEVPDDILNAAPKGEF